MAVSQTSGQTNIWQLAAQGDVLTGMKRVYGIFIKQGTSTAVVLNATRDGASVELYNGTPALNALVVLTTSMTTPDPGVYSNITLTTATGSNTTVYVVTDDDCIRS